MADGLVGAGPVDPAVRRAHGLDDLGVGVRGGQRVECSVRWIYQHTIEEYARHNGHADLIRELIDGAAD